MTSRFVLNVLTAAALAATVGPAPLAAAPSTAPDFPFHDTSGAPHTLAERRGDVVVLEFWASWCAPCRKGFPFLNELQAKHRAAGLAVVAVTLEDDGEAVADFLEAVPARFLVGRDPTGRAGEVFKVAAMPTTIILDRQGRVAARFEGGTESVHRQIESTVAALVEGRPLDPSVAVAGRKGPSGNLRAWDRGYLADPIMSLDGDILGRVIREHVFSSKEAAAGDGGVAGGGCGCN